MDDHTTDEAADLTFWGRHRVMLMIGLSIVVAMMLVGVSLALYASSGAAQLDLSRPGYRAVSDQAENGDGGFENYSAAGTIDQKSINEFQSIYDKQATKAKAVDAFSGDPLNPDALEISAQTTTE